MMWCRSCQQDVPAFLSPTEDDKYCCARCGGDIRRNGFTDQPTTEQLRTADETVQPSAAVDPSIEGFPSDPKSLNDSAADLRSNASSRRIKIDDWNIDDWDNEEQWCEAERLVGGSPELSGHFLDSLAPNTTGKSHPTINPMNDPWNAELAPTFSDTKKFFHSSLDSSQPAILPDTGLHSNVEHRSPVMAWTLLSLGLMVFACGVILLIWGNASNRDDLWGLGLPLAISGQAGLLIGLILQLDGLWHSNRATTTSLGQLDHRLNEVKHATTMLTTTHSVPARSLHAHLAQDASPQIMLADLKDQLDMLAIKISRDGN